MSEPAAAAPDPPKRGPGRPRFVERRILVGFPAEVLADVEREAAERGTAVSAEVVRRCRP